MTPAAIVLGQAGADFDRHGVIPVHFAALLQKFQGGSCSGRQRRGSPCRAAPRRLPSSPPIAGRRAPCIRQRRRSARRGRAGRPAPCRAPRCRDIRSRCSNPCGPGSGGPGSTADGRIGRAARTSGSRHAETDLRRHRRHRRHDHHRIVHRDLRGVDDRRPRATLVDVVDADDVGQKDPVELTAFG
jgi:hypothetical protein